MISSTFSKHKEILLVSESFRTSTRYA